MALYWHVEDKQALLDALGERMFASVELPEPVDGWFEDLCAVCRAIVAELHRHPGVAPLAVTTVLTSEAGVRVAERVLSRLCNAGFSDRDVADIGAYLLRAIVVLVTALPGEMPCSDEDAERMQRKHAHLANLPVDRYPIVARLAGELTECGDPEALLASGVDVLMLGIKGFAERVTSTGG
jgi:AcrR family transcriptional regulator